MDNNKGNTNSYNAEDIIRYLEGKMSLAEMHAIEKAALEDPMLADAIEGIQLSISSYGLQQTIDPLDKLKQAKNDKSRMIVPVRNIKWWSIAAAASVLIVAGALTFNYFVQSKSSQDKISQVEKTTTPEDTAESFPSTPQSTSSSANADSLLLPEKSEQKNVVSNLRKPKSASANEKPLDAVDNPTESAKPESEKTRFYESNAEGRDLAKKERNDSAVYGPPVASATQNNQRSAAPSSRMELRNQVISGRVLNTALEPLSNVSLLPSNSNRPLNTDNNGNFIFSSPDSVLTVKVSAAGYQEQQFRLSNSRAINEIVLKQSSTNVEEVVVTGYGQKNTRKKSADLELSQPVPGWSTFNEYVEKNKVYPAERNYLSGVVTVSFEVNRQGKPVDIKVEKSLAKPYDDEAIRLIEKGPKWKFIKGKREKTLVTIRF